MKSLFTPLLAVCLSGFCAQAQINLTSGLVAYYPFDGNFVDSSGNGHDGTAYGGMGFTTDQWGNPGYAAAFDGMDDYILVPPSVQLTPDSAFSLAFFFLSSANTDQKLVSKSDWVGMPNVDNIQYQVGFNYVPLGAKTVYLGTHHDGDCITQAFLSDDYVISQDTVADSTWTQVVAIFDHGVKSLYLDGVLTARDTISGMVNNYTVDDCNLGYLKFGTWWDGDPQFLKGAIDDMRVYNRPLNDQEVDSLNKMSFAHTTGVASTGMASSRFSLYPNPVSNRLCLDFTGVYSALAIYDNIGRVVVTQQVSGNAAQVNTETLPAGIYHLRLSGPDGIITRTFIK